MSRIIKFRGKSRRTNNYVYGSYWFNPFTKQHLIKQLCEGGTQLEDVECTTIEQFTGLFDKNKVEVYEGDSLHVCAGYSSIVVYDDYQSCFISRYSHPEDPKYLLLCDLGQFEVIR